MYKLLIKLAFNSAFARPSRTLLVILMIAVSMGTMLSVQGLYDGMAMNMLDRTKRSDSGEISLYHKEYRLNRTLQNVIERSEQIRDSLRKQEDIEAVALRMSVDGLCATARKSSFASIIGIDLQAEESFGNFSEFLHEGSLVFGKHGALIGSELAKTLKLQVGSKIIFSTQERSGEINAVALRVRGILQIGNIGLDRSAVYVPRERLNGLLGIDSTVSTQIAVRSSEEGVLYRLKKSYPELEVKGFKELYPMLQQMEEMMLIFNSITFFIIMLVVFIGISGVMYVSILDRVREFGILRSIGLSYGYIRTQIILEAVFISLIGYVFGVVFGVLGLLYLQYVGLDLSRFAEGMQSFGMGTTLYAHIKISYFTHTFLAIFSASIISVILPLRKIKGLNPIEVIKADE